MPTVYARTLKRAAEIVGGDTSLAVWLRVTPSHLSLWLSGTEDPPVEINLPLAAADGKPRDPAG